MRSSTPPGWLSWCALPVLTCACSCCRKKLERPLDFTSSYRQNARVSALIPTRSSVLPPPDVKNVRAYSAGIPASIFGVLVRAARSGQTATPVRIDARRAIYGAPISPDAKCVCVMSCSCVWTSRGVWCVAFGKCP